MFYNNNFNDKSMCRRLLYTAKILKDGTVCRIMYFKKCPFLSGEKKVHGFCQILIGLCDPEKSKNRSCESVHLWKHFYFVPISCKGIFKIIGSCSIDIGSAQRESFRIIPDAALRPLSPLTLSLAFGWIEELNNAISHAVYKNLTTYYVHLPLPSFQY